MLLPPECVARQSVPPHYVCTKRDHISDCVDVSVYQKHVVVQELIASEFSNRRVWKLCTSINAIQHTKEDWIHAPHHSGYRVLPSVSHTESQSEASLSINDINEASSVKQ